MIQLDEDNELETYVKQVAAIAPLQPSNLLGILQRHMTKSLMDVKSSHSKEVIIDYVERALPFASGSLAVKLGTTFDIKQPHMSVLAPLLPAEEVCAKIRSWLFADYLFPKLIACESAVQAGAISSLVVMMTECLDIPEELDCADAIVALVVDATEVCSALQLLCEKAINANTDVANMEIVKRMNTIAEQSLDSSLLGSCGRNAKESPFLAKQLTELISCDDTWHAKVVAVQGSLATLHELGSERSMVSIEESLSQIEKYKPTLPANSLLNLEQVAFSKVKALYEWAKADAGIDSETIGNVQRIAQMAQRVFPKEPALDTVLSDLAELLVGFSQARTLKQFVALLGPFGAETRTSEECSKFIEVEKSSRNIHLDQATRESCLDVVKKEMSMLWTHGGEFADRPPTPDFDNIFLRLSSVRPVCDRLGDAGASVKSDFDMAYASINLWKQAQCFVQADEENALSIKSANTTTIDTLVALKHACSQLFNLTKGDKILTTTQQAAHSFMELLEKNLIQPEAVKHAENMKTEYQEKVGEEFNCLAAGQTEKAEMWCLHVPQMDWGALAARAKESLLQINKPQLEKMVATAKDIHHKYVEHAQTFGVSQEREVLKSTLAMAKVTLWERQLFDSYCNTKGTLVEMRRETQCVKDSMKAEKIGPSVLHSALVERMKLATKLKQPSTK